MIQRVLLRYRRLQERLPERFRVSPAIAALAPILLIGLWLYMWNAGQTISQGLSADIRVLDRRLVIAREAEPELVWRERAAGAQVRLGAMRDSVLWRGETDGVVTAQIQSTVAGIVGRSGIERGRVRLSDTAITLEGVTFYEVTIEGLFEPRAVGALIEGLERHQPLLKIIAVDASLRQPNTVRLVVHAAIEVGP